MPQPERTIPNTQNDIIFSLGTSAGRASQIFPLFMPFAGCPTRCVYCAQDLQTGHPDSVKPTKTSPTPNVSPAQATLDEQLFSPALAALRQRTKSTELAFYGGTFTALAPAIRQACLAFFTQCRAENLVVAGRCSTRPDAVPPSRLQPLLQAGLSLVELGVQSFHTPALTLSQRSYSGQQALAGCKSVQDSGLSLGIQLLPGMPGLGPEEFLADVDTALALRPACLRFYPCLVPQGTVLAAWWKQGRYTPWSVPETVATLGEALRRAWAAQVPVLRLSVAPEPAFDAQVLAGPRHPALGSMIQAEALLRTVENLCSKVAPPLQLMLPKTAQGFLYGQHNALKARWATLGFTPENIFWHGLPYGILQRGGNNTPPC